MRIVEIVNPPDMQTRFDVRKLQAKFDEQQAEIKQLRLSLAALHETVKKLITILGSKVK